VADSIFASDITDEVQQVDNRYRLCHGLFDRARKVNVSPVTEGSFRPNPTVRALTDYSGTTPVVPEIPAEN
jgi:DNA-directed RNA polymerase subunit K/omega|tara:strand:- start:237 stop:449 length:213 start_codon:yes stop_codon:yes gene_type:complete